MTAWELLFDRMQISERGDEQRKDESKKNLLIVGGAGGVGSIMIQLARELTSLTIIATASRAESAAWCRDLGAHVVIDHSKSSVGDKPLVGELQKHGIESVDYIASLTHTNDYYASYVQIIAPQGKLGVIDDLHEAIDIRLLKAKCASLHWEFMFARPAFKTADMIEQHHILETVSAMIDSGALRNTHTKTLGTINAVNLRQAHQLIESGRTIGKITLAGFE